MPKFIVILFLLVPVFAYQDGDGPLEYDREGEAPEEPIPLVTVSPVALTNLARTEIEIHKYLKEYAEKMEIRMKEVKAYIEDFEESSLKGTSNFDYGENEVRRAADIAAHPFMTLRMIRRYSKSLGKLQYLIEQKVEQDFINKMKKLQGKRLWPTHSEYTDVLFSIFRLQSNYELDLLKFSDGELDSQLKSKVSLTSEQSLEVAKFAMDHDYFTLAMDWLQYTKSQLSPTPNVHSMSSIGEKEIEAEVEKLIQKHDANWDELNKNQNFNFIYSSKMNQSHEAPLKKMIQHSIEVRDAPEGLNVPLDNMQKDFFALCNGKNLQPEFVKARLYCWNEHFSHPYWAINPLKLELLSDDPYVVQAYDFIGFNFSKELRKMSVRYLEPPPPLMGSSATPRSAMYAWLGDEEFPELEPFIRRIEHYSGLKALGQNASTHLQIASYAFGGYVSPHWDSYGEGYDDPKGDRVMTALFYLNEVTKGGLTAFPLLGLSVKPVRGSGVFWYTARDDGEVDDRMLHGACPVIIGQKWIATKWIHLNENFLNRPCPRYQSYQTHETFKF